MVQDMKQEGKLVLMMRWCDGSGIPRGNRGLALVALGEEPECVDLPHEVSHTSPSAEPEPNYKHPNHNEGVEHVHPRPAR